MAAEKNNELLMNNHYQIPIDSRHNLEAKANDARPKEHQKVYSVGMVVVPIEVEERLLYKTKAVIKMGETIIAMVKGIMVVGTTDRLGMLRKLTIVNAIDVE